MAESDGGSRRARKRGLGLFQRRRPPTQATTQSRQSATPDRKPPDQKSLERKSLESRRDPRSTGSTQSAVGGGRPLGESASASGRSLTKPWTWFRGTRDDAARSLRRRARPSSGPDLSGRSTPRSQTASQPSRLADSTSRRSPIAPLSLTDFEPSRDRRNDSRLDARPIPRPNPRLDSRLGHQGDARGGRSDRPVQPTDPRSKRRSRPSRPPSTTHLQANQPTLIQASTAFQRDTLLQDQDRTSRTARDAEANQRVTQLESRRRSRRPERPSPERPSRPLPRSLAIALYAARMLILSVGVGVLAGTLLSAWNPLNSALNGEMKQPLKQANTIAGTVAAPSPQAPASLSLGQELAAVKTAVQATTQQYPGFTPGVFLLDLDTNQFMDWSGSVSFSAASTIKVPILIAFFQDVDAGKIRLDEKLTMRKELVAPEAGDMQYQAVGTQFSALETATKMITISDNTATNLLIDRLGGIAAVNQRFKSWGLTTTQVKNLLPDLEGTNTTSPKELASLMVRVSQGELVSLRSRDRLLDIMRRTVNNSQLPQGLGEGATIAHKTGDIASVIGDVGLVDLPSGKRYATAVLVRRSENDDRAYDLVQKISRVMYQHFVSQPGSKVSPATKPTPDPEQTETGTQPLTADSEVANYPDPAP